MSRRLILIVIAVIVVGGGVAAWIIFSKPALPPGFAGGNGRLEAKEIYISTKYPGRIKDVLFDEGDTVEAGQVVARMDTTALEAQLREAQAQIKQAQDSRDVALAQVRVKQANYDFAAKDYRRSQELVGKGAVSQQEADLDNAKMLAARAELDSAKVSVVQTASAIDAAKATADRLQSEINDATLVSPIRARVETRLSEPGEVLPAGGRVFAVNDLSDVYMYVYLPEAVTGKIPLGSEARIVLDAAPDYPIRTYVSFISPVAQFTPKTVETAEERHNLTFRVKLQLDKNRLREYEPLVKVGPAGYGLRALEQQRDVADEPAVQGNAAGQPLAANRRGPGGHEHARQRRVQRAAVMDAATAEWVVSVKGVTQRYGKTVALDDINLDIPGQQDDRPDRARRGRQVDAARRSSPVCARSSPARCRCSVATSTMRDFATRSPRASPICPRASARISIRRSRSSRTSTSSVACSANRARSASGGSTICSTAPI